LETYLLSREQWQGDRVALAQAHQLPLAFDSHWPKLVDLLRDELRQLDESLPGNPDLEIRDGNIQLAGLEKNPIPESAEALKNTLRRLQRCAIQPLARPSRTREQRPRLPVGSQPAEDRLPCGIQDMTRIFEQRRHIQAQQTESGPAKSGLQNQAQQKAGDQ
jgi:hypothetical protein